MPQRMPQTQDCSLSATVYTYLVIRMLCLQYEPQKLLFVVPRPMMHYMLVVATVLSLGTRMRVVLCLCLRCDRPVHMILANHVYLRP